jgi:hypothetical protein
VARIFVENFVGNFVRIFPISDKVLDKVLRSEGGTATSDLHR